MKMIRRKQFPGKTAALALALTTVILGGCGKSGQAAKPTEPSPTPAQAAVTETAAPTAAPIKPVRQVGERFEGSFTFQGMEEKVQYEHIRSDAVGFEMDLDYESFKRVADADTERFVSVWDDPAKPENYLEVRADAGSAESVAEALTAELSKEYDVTTLEQQLDSGARAIRLEASVVKGTNQMAENLNSVYIIPAPDGCRVAWVRCFVTDSEGFSLRVSKMVNTLTAIDRK